MCIESREEEGGGSEAYMHIYVAARGIPKACGRQAARKAHELSKPWAVCREAGRRVAGRHAGAAEIER